MKVLAARATLQLNNDACINCASGQTWPCSETWREIFCWETWARGCPSDRACSMAVSGTISSDQKAV